ncbi:MAG: DNA polymerase III subunit chi [Alphaproteobacteria bacterium]|nr:DNA polymerase III subunit chi [Alphaproteobacteria bacterium]
MRIDFYRLQRHTPEEVLFQILQKQLETNENTLIFSNKKERLSFLSTFLWTHNSKVFIPHGTDKEAFKEEQPILLTSKEENQNKATLLVLLDGSLFKDLSGFKRCLYFSQENDPKTIQNALEFYKKALQEEADIFCWQEDKSGRWVSKSEP